MGGEWDMDKIIIFGCGEQGQTAFSALKNQYDIIAFSDIDSDKWGKPCHGIDVISPEQISSTLPPAGYVVICDVRFQQIARTLEALGVNYTVQGSGQFEGKFVDYSVKNGFNLGDVLVNVYSNTPVVPKTLRLELSTKCNMKCKYCYCFREDESFLDECDSTFSTDVILSWDVLRATVAQVKHIDTVKKLWLTARGELFMNKEWYEMINYVISETSIDELEFSTNGMALTKDNVDKLSKLPISRLLIQGSADGTSAQENDYWRIGSDYKLVKQNLNHAMEVLSVSSINDVRLVINNVNVLPPEFLSDTKTYGDVISYLNQNKKRLSEDFPRAKISPIVAVPSPKININEWQTLDGTSIKMMDDLRLFNPCTHSFSTVFVTSTGEIKCVGKGARKPIGNVLTDNLYEVWMNSPFLNERRNARRNGKPICRGCQVSMSTRRYMFIRNFMFDWEAN